ncbi:dihydroneopterin aldolase [Oceaniglobus roseus]|uniref:dihydroneopterin aldolase n=1 Tax=Oceaniglobus roseus TaxID=1737570 RepID=UPI000C7F53CA|nr:dihydroneopterin aldolase [Kandeliimicrobium roseum]
MSRDLHLAFGHPELRATATEPAGMPEGMFDRISLRDHIVTVDIGAFQQERGAPQRICFNLVVEVAPHGAAADDDVDKILSYDTLTEAIAHELAAERINLLETLAERIALRVLAAPLALRCFVRIEKLDRGPGALGVEIVRARGDRQRLAAAGVEVEVPHPVVVYLDNAALASDRLTGWIDELEGSGQPAILCVGAPSVEVPRSASAAAQRRIDLLAIEQNAWVLAGRDRRCVVVGTRTELDWAMKHDELTVWAPSKLILDSARGPAVLPRSGPALARWFATEMQAARLIYVGTGGEGEGEHLPADTPALLQA